MYEEFKVVRTILEGYANTQSQGYTKWISELKAIITNCAFDINDSELINKINSYTCLMNEILLINRIH